MNILLARLGIIVGSILAFAAMGLFSAQHAQAKDSVAVGEGSFEFTPDAKRPQHKLTVWTNRPKEFGPSSPIVIVMHGTKRNGQEYRDAWKQLSTDGGFLLLVPEFPVAEYPETMYQQGNIRDADDKPLPAERWTFNAIETLFDHAKGLTGSRVEKYQLYGHSAGGQFVHRFVLFMPEARYARAIAANPGYYTFPTQAAEYPYGLKGASLADRPQPAVFKRDFVVLLGDADTIRDDPDLRKTPQADAQGLTRFERGKNFYQSAKQVAQQSSAPFKWQQVIVPGVGHSNAKMAPAAARVLFTP